MQYCDTATQLFYSRSYIHAAEVIVSYRLTKARNKRNFHSEKSETVFSGKEFGSHDLQMNFSKTETTSPINSDMIALRKHL